MDDIDEMPINTLPQNQQTGPDPEVIENNDQQTKVTRGLQFARKLELVENMQRRR